jgi:hypothetical protein
MPPYLRAAGFPNGVFFPAWLAIRFPRCTNIARSLRWFPLRSRSAPLNQTITCGLFYLALRSTGVAGMPAGQFFLIVPLGLVTTAVPISPAGIGVGQAAFFTLFRIVAPAYAPAGTAAFTVYQAMVILLCMTGLFWYLPYKHTGLTGIPDTPWRTPASGEKDSGNPSSEEES